MRPRIQVLDDALRNQIVAEARDLLLTLGVTIHHPAALRLLADYGATVDLALESVRFPGPVIDRALASALPAFRLFDVLGNETHNFVEGKIHFTPGSSAINILDGATREIRKPVTADYVRYARVVGRLPHLAAQSTAFIPSDVPEMISDSYRLYLSLLHCEKPVVTGAFSIKALSFMKDLLVVVRGSEAALREKPLAIFTCCPTSPLKWSEESAQHVIDCARLGIPVEIVSMPMAGFISPVTIVGTLIQHTTENLSGVILSQAAQAGAPLLYGGSPGVFDVRYETTPMGAVETQMIDCGACEIAHSMGLPAQAYISLSDSKDLDAQAGLETSMGATLASLAGINSISGPGMLDFENCQSLEKLVVDNEIAGMMLRLVRGIEPREDFPALPRFQELLKEKHLLISRHSRKYWKQEQYQTGPVINRAKLSRWQEEGSSTLFERARSEIERHLRDSQPSRLPDETQRELTRLMAGEARQHGMDQLPALT